jgi:hypothetical protein
LNIKEILSDGIGDLISFALDHDPRQTIYNTFHDRVLQVLIIISILIVIVVTWVFHSILSYLVETGHVSPDLIIWILSVIFTVDLLLTGIHWGEK